MSRRVATAGLCGLREINEYFEGNNATVEQLITGVREIVWAWSMDLQSMKNLRLEAFIFEWERLLFV